MALCVSLLEKSLLSFPENAMAVNEVPVSRVFLVSLIPPSSSSFSPLITAVYQFQCLVSFSVLDGDPSFPPFFFRNRCKPPFIVKKKRAKVLETWNDRRENMYIHSVKILYLPLAPGYFIIFLFDPFTPAVFLSDFPKSLRLWRKKKK